MNLEADPQLAQLRELLASCNDRAGDHLLWVRKTGEVELSRLPKGTNALEFARNQPDLRLHYSPFQAGYEYVGPEAAADDDWVRELFENLVGQWQATRDQTEAVFAGDLW